MPAFFNDGSASPVHKAENRYYCKRLFCLFDKRAFCVEQVKGVEPSYQAWEACVLPMNYTCKFLFIIPRLSALFKYNILSNFDLFCLHKTLRFVA